MNSARLRVKPFGYNNHAAKLFAPPSDAQPNVMDSSSRGVTRYRTARQS
jgi:hypothetical protein